MSAIAAGAPIVGAAANLLARTKRTDRLLPIVN